MKSKIAGGCLLALYIGSAMGQSAHVTTAYSLYKACFQGTVTAQSIYSTDTLQAAEVAKIVDDIDQTCLDWTYAWYPAFMNGTVTELRPDEMIRFNQMRFALVDYLLKELSELLPGNKNNPPKKK